MMCTYQVSNLESRCNANFQLHHPIFNIIIMCQYNYITAYMFFFYSNATSRKAGLFRMMVWLVAYYEFYDKGVSCNTAPQLSNYIESISI